MPRYVYIVAVALKRRSGQPRLLVRRTSGSSSAHLRAALGSSLHLRRNSCAAYAEDLCHSPAVLYTFPDLTATWNPKIRLAEDRMPSESNHVNTDAPALYNVPKAHGYVTAICEQDQLERNPAEIHAKS